MWQNDASLFVGHGGAGTLTIVNGGTVRNGDSFVGHLSGADGVVTVQGSASRWLNDRNLAIGGNIGGTAGPARGRLRLEGGSVAADAIAVRSAGVLEIGSGSKLETSVLTFEGGTLRALGDIALSTDTFVGPAGMIVDSNGLDVTLRGILSGSGTFRKVGAGAVNLAGANTYVGDTRVEAGTLITDGSVASAVTVGAPATLGGSGTVNGNLINNGSVSPGAAAGKLTVNGDYTQSSSAVLKI